MAFNIFLELTVTKGIKTPNFSRESFARLKIEQLCVGNFVFSSVKEMF
jgi:hypothetical protein